MAFSTQKERKRRGRKKGVENMFLYKPYPTQYTASTKPSHCLCCHLIVTRISQGGKKAVPN